MALTPALLVPDGETWLAWGDEPAGVRDADPGRARALVVARELPDALAEALAGVWPRLPVLERVELRDAPLRGRPVAELLTAAARPPSRAEEDEHDGHGDMDHGDMDHGDMMAITGEPSADGLVMEDVDVRVGPIGVALATGLVVEAALDGDVVASCEVRATLPGADGLAGAGAPAAARARAHLAHLLRVARLLGWPAMARHVRAAVGGGAGEAAALHRRLDRSRLLAARTRGLAVHEGRDARDRLVACARAAAALRAGDDPGGPPPAAGSARRAAASCAVGLEWSSALVAIASFAPSPWTGEP